MGHIHAIQTPDSSTHLIEPLLFATTGGTASAITASISNFELVAGVSITLKITTTNEANATLSINGETAKSIYYNNNAIIANILKQNYIYNLVYDGNVWNVLGMRYAEAEMTLPHKLTFGEGGTYVYDGSADITVPVYTGGIF